MKNKTLKIIAITLGSLLLLMLISATIGYIWLTNSDGYVHFDTNRLKNINNTLTLLDKDGNKIDSEIYVNGYKYVSAKNLHKYTLDAFVSIEDKRFYNHKGLDLQRIGGAIIANLKNGGYSQGASTISQQLIKNTHLDNQKTIVRKLNEMLLAGQLEQNFTKDQILEMYVNTIYFGNSAYGIESASNMYFGKSAKELTISESAVLAGMIKSPANYSPLTHYDNAIKRRNIVLACMLDNGYISSQEYANALDEHPKNNEKGILSLERDYTYAVIDEACKILNMSQVQLLNSHLTIKTYLNPQIQQAVKQSVLQNDTTYTNNKVADLVAIMCDKTSGGICAYYSKGTRNLWSKQQIGSTIKPFAVYAPAIQENQITQASMLLDEQTSFNGYAPHNFGDSYKGWITVKEALTRSSNVCAVKTLNNLGINKSCKYLNKMGLNITNEQNLSMALGNVNGGLDCTQLLQAYNTLNNNGILNEVSFIQSISNDKGTVYTHKQINRKVFDQQTSFLLTDMLRATTISGTAKALNGLGFDIAAKTGTVGNSNGNTDAIVSGYTNQHSFVVWLGGKGTMSNNITGGTAPCNVAKNMLTSVYADNKPSDFEVPQGIIQQQIDNVSLHNDNKLLIANMDIPQNERATYYFSTQKCATEISKRYNDKLYNLNVIDNGEYISIELPQTNYNIKLYRITNGIKTQLALEGNIYCDYDVYSGNIYQYYAEYSQNGQIVTQSKIFQISLTDNLQNESNEETENTPNNQTDHTNERDKNSWWKKWFFHGKLKADK